jgi:hypothetical protein
MPAQSNTLLEPEDRIINEGSTRTYKITLLDSDGETPIPSADVTSILATLYDIETGGIINDREDQSIKNENNGTYHATSGLLTLTLQADDNTVVTERPHGERERHRLELVVTLTNGTIFTYYEEFEIVSFTEYPAVFDPGGGGGVGGG